MNTGHAGETVPLHFRRYGDPGNAKLIILHGLFGSGGNWRSIAKGLAATYEVFCPDLRNHGQSPWHDAMDYPALAGDVARFIGEHRLHGAAVLGHSMGGKTAMTLAQARDEPGRAAPGKLIVVDIAPTPYPAAAHRELIAAMGAVDLAAASRAQVDASLAARIPDRATRQFLAQNLRRDGDGYAWRLNLNAIARHLDALTGYENEGVAQSETLFIAGANSDYLRPADPGAMCAIHRRFPNARIETVEGAGHWVHAEQPERLLALCNAFLTD